MKRALLTTLTVSALIPTLVSPTAHAQQPEAPVLGSYKLSISKSKARARVDARIEALVDEMNFLIRPIARSKLQNSSLICGRFSFDTEGDDLLTRCDGARVDRSSRHGKKGKTVYNGEEYVLIQRLDGRRVFQSFTGGDGVRSSRYELSEDGRTLTMKTRISSDQLPRPLEYTLVYERQ